MATLTERYRTLKARLQKLFDQYGYAALVTWFDLFFSVLFTFVVLIERGLAEPPETAAGTWVAAYFLTETTKPIRIVITIALTPFVAQVSRRMLGKNTVGKNKTDARPETPSADAVQEP